MKFSKVKFSNNRKTKRVERFTNVLERYMCCLAELVTTTSTSNQQANFMVRVFYNM